jgi:hypothetical protein
MTPRTRKHSDLGDMKEFKRIYNNPNDKTEEEVIHSKISLTQMNP